MTQEAEVGHVDTGYICQLVSSNACVIGVVKEILASNPPTMHCADSLPFLLLSDNYSPYNHSLFPDTSLLRLADASQGRTSHRKKISNDFTALPHL